MDPNSSFKLKIKLLGNRKKCRQDMKCFSFDMVVDLDKINYEDLVESVVEKYLPGYLEVAHIQYYDEGLKSFPEFFMHTPLLTTVAGRPKTERCKGTGDKKKRKGQH